MGDGEAAVGTASRVKMALGTHDSALDLYSIELQKVSATS